MTIDELNALTTLTAADEVPVWDSEESGEPTKKITASNLAASVKSLGNLIGTGDLDSTPTQGSNKAVTSGGTYTAIQQSTASIPKIKHTTVTGTTSANGALNLNINTSVGLVFSAVPIDVSALVVCLVVRSTSGSQWIYAKKGTDMSAIANQSVTLDVYYI